MKDGFMATCGIGAFVGLLCLAAQVVPASYLIGVIAVGLFIGECRADTGDNSAEDGDRPSSPDGARTEVAILVLHEPRVYLDGQLLHREEDSLHLASQYPFLPGSLVQVEWKKVVTLGEVIACVRSEGEFLIRIDVAHCLEKPRRGRMRVIRLESSFK